MDKREIEHIKCNWDILSRTTICNSDLTGSLREKGLITTDEANRLVDLTNEAGTVCAAEQLYKIFIEKFEMVDKLLRLQVNLSGLTKPLYQMFPNFTWCDALNVLEFGSMNMQSLSLITIIKLGHELPTPRPLYVPRLLSNRRKLDPKLFRIDCKDVFVFKGVSKNVLHQLIEPNVLRSSIGQRSYVSCRHIYLEDDEDWDYIEQICSHPLHLVCKDGEDYVLMRSTKITDVILKHSVGPHYSEEAYVSEDSFLTHTLCHKNTRGVLICDLPGMGKTWLLERLAIKLRQETTNIVVFYVSLQHFSIFFENQQSHQSQEIPPEVFFGQLCNTNLGVCVLKQIIAKRDINLSLVLDGFDELSENHSNQLIFFLVSLSQSKHCNIKIVVSSRPHLRACLEKKFNLISFDILPFQTREQIDFIMSVWVQEYPNIDDNTLEAFAKQCLNSIKSIQNATCDNIVGIPLKCYMFARINRKFVRQLSIATGKTSFRVPDIAIFKSTGDLYEEFAKESLQKISMPEYRQRVLNFHTFKALQLILPPISEAYMLVKNLKSAVIFNDVHKVGILTLSDDKTFVFIHRSFAEYFVGRFFAKFWNNPNAYERSFATLVVLDFINTALDVKVSDKSNQVHFNKIDSIGIPTMQTFEFRYSSMLTFMNHNLQNFTNARGAAWRYLKRWMLPSKIPCPVYQKETSFSKISQGVKDAYMIYRINLRTKTPFALLACLDNGFTSIIYLIGQLLTSLFPAQELKSLIQLTRKNEKSLVPADWTAAVFTSKMALSGSIEICNALFNICSAFADNYLLRYCKEFPKEFYSPIEIAIAKSDPEMFEFFFSKVELPWKRLIIRCLLGSQMSESEIASRVKIFEAIMKEKIPFSALSSSDYGAYLADLSTYETTNLRLLKNFVSKHDICLNHLSQHCKTVLLRDSIINDSDDGFTELIELLFYVDNNEISQNRTQFENGESVTSNIDYLPKTNPKRSTGKLNLKEACETFQNLKLFQEHIFQNIHTVETLELLCKIAPDFSLCNGLKMNYIHFAAALNKVNWIPFLFNQAHDANQKDLFGGTPLHKINPENALELTTLLIDNGVNVFAVDDHLNNFAHKLVLTCGLRGMRVPEELISYTIDNGYFQLWSMKNSVGITPFEILSDQLSPDHRLLRLLPPHVRHKSSTIANKLVKVIYNGSDHQYISIILGHFNKMDRLQPRRCFLQNETIPGNEYEASKVLQGLDIPLARKVMSKFCISFPWGAFKNMHSVEMLKVQLAICPDFSVCNNHQFSYMHLAVCQGKVDWVEFLIKSGQDINQSDYMGNSPLLRLNRNSAEITRILLQNGADVNHLNYRQENAAHKMLELQKINELNIIHSWVAYTVHNGLEKLWDAKNGEGHAALEILSELIDNIGIQMEPVAIDSKSLLFIFNKEFRLDFSDYSGTGNFNLNSLCAIIFGRKQNLQHISYYQKQWLFRGAILAGTEIQIIHLLLLLFPSDNVEITEAGKIVHNQQNSDNITAEDILDLLDVANAKNILQTAQLGAEALKNVKSLEILKILTVIIPDFRLINSFGCNYLHCAVYWGRPNWVKYLLLAGHDVNQRDNDGSTPILRLSPFNLMEVTRLLIENGCDALVVNKYNETFVERLSRNYKSIGQHIPEEFTEYAIDKMFRIHGALFHSKFKRYVKNWRFP